MSPIGGMGYDNGKKVPQVGGNTANIPKPPSQVGGNNTNAPIPAKSNTPGGNYFPGVGTKGFPK